MEIIELNTDIEKANSPRFLKLIGSKVLVRDLCYPDCWAEPPDRKYFIGKIGEVLNPVNEFLLICFKENIPLKYPSPDGRYCFRRGSFELLEDPDHNY